MPTDESNDYAAVFEAWAEAYRTADEIAELVSRAEFAGAQVLEVGCGSGRLTTRLAPRATTYVAIDIDDRLVRHCATAVPADAAAEVLLASGEALPFQSNAIDITVDGWALTAQEASLTLSEYTRVTRDGGTILIIAESWDEPDRPNSEYVRALRTFAPDIEWYDLHEELYQPVYDAFDPAAIDEVPITTGYVFSSVQEAVKGFKFHLTAYHSYEVPSANESQLQKYLQQFVTSDGQVHLSEHATLFVICL